MLGFLAALLAWQIVAASGLLEPSLLATPAQAFTALWRLLASGSVLPDLQETLMRMFAGYGLAVAAGVAAGLLLGSVRPLYEAFSGVVDFFRSTPVTTLYPLFVLLFGVKHLSKVAMVFWACFFVITLNAAYGAIRASRLRLDMARLYGASRWQVIRWVLFRDALPQAMIGLRVGLSYALIVEILCEMFMGSQYGLGQRVTEAYTTYLIADLYALVLLTGVVGFILNRAFVRLERRIIPWVEADV